MATVLFVCLHNAGRSQMSAALFERAAAGRHHALSAGTTPAEHVHPEVVEVMREPGFAIDLATRRPQLLTREHAQQADVVVTMGCGDRCPYIPGKRYIEWDLQDPRGRTIDEVRAIRDEIARRIDELLGELDARANAKPSPTGRRVSDSSDAGDRSQPGRR
jgi:arsenate reductase